MAADLSRDHQVNGHTFKAGKGVDTSITETDSDGKQKKVDYAESLIASENAANDAEAFAATHHGAVPVPDDPNAPTAQTPTRPLGYPELRVEETVTTGIKQGNPHEMKDPK